MRVPLIAETELDANQAAEVDFFGRSAWVLRDGQRVRAFLNVCMHLGGPLQLADNAQSFECQWHQACFDAGSGQATRGPARPDSRLIRLPVIVEDGQVVYVYGERDQPTDT
jgi:nitrite reductase/ring-hydroxylating ferredoxin subunit